MTLMVHGTNTNRIDKSSQQVRVLHDCYSTRTKNPLYNNPSFSEKYYIGNMKHIYTVYLTQYFNNNIESRVEMPACMSFLVDFGSTDILHCSSKDATTEFHRVSSVPWHSFLGILVEVISKWQKANTNNVD